MNVRKCASYSKNENHFPDDLENKYIHKGMIFVSISLLLFIKCIGNVLKNIGSYIEDFLNGKRKALSSIDKNSSDYISIVGQTDSRKELNKDIKHEDGRYYPSLSMMASKLAYENESVIRKTVSQHWKMEFLNFFDCYNASEKEATTQAFLMREETRKDDKIILAFRGTSAFDAGDWRTDFDFSWCQVPGLGKTHKGFMTALGLENYYPNNNDQLLGDYTAYFPNQIDHQQDPEKAVAYYVIRDTLKQIIANNKRAKLIVTGHSLGGALAILFPAILALHGEVELLDKLEAIYTFGQPRVGNAQFGQFMKKSLNEHNIKYYRIVYNYDIVPEVPLDYDKVMTYKHFGISIHLNTFYQGKIVEEEQSKGIKENKNESVLMKYLKKLMKLKIAWLIAVWEVIRGFTIRFTAGPYYREGCLLLGFRIAAIFFPPLIYLVNHNPQDYVNATMLASEDLFKYYPALH
ncbi:unnamed protein product [Amaranthus hypochondriacus]